MNTVKSTIIASAVFGLIAGVGIVGQPSSTFAMDAMGEQKSHAMEGQQGSEKGAANTPSNIQRSTPSGNEFPGSGSGPGSRADKLTEMDDVEAKKNPADPSEVLKEKGIAAESQK